MALDGDVDLDTEQKDRARIALASTLARRAAVWLESNENVREKVAATITASLAGIGETSEALGQATHDWRTDRTFLAHVVFERWLRDPSPRADGDVLKLVSSGDEKAVRRLFSLAHSRRHELGLRWHRLLDLAILWAGLSVLRPRYDEDSNCGDRWLHRFRRLSLSKASSAQRWPHAVAIAERVEKLER